VREFHDERDPDLFPRRRDIEFTLGPRLQLLAFFLIVAACGLCFGLGYSLGSHSHAAESATADQKAPIEAAGGARKPAATASTVPQAPARAVVALPGTPAAPPAPGPETSDAGWTVKQALPPQQPAPAATLPAGQPQPALPTGAAAPGQFLVQIAAVAHPEDADVLLSALRKRGYLVNARRDPADNLIHVRIGPYSSRRDAETMQQKLLNDGYNAQVQ
jgi:DedD protein